MHARGILLPQGKQSWLTAGVLGCLLWGMISPFAEAAEEGLLELRRLFESPSIAGTAPSSPRWSPDSGSIAFRWNDAGEAHRDLWVASAGGIAPARKLSPPDAPSLSELVWAPDSEEIYSLRGQQLWSTRIDAETHRLLASLAGNASDLQLSPDGTRLTWLQDGDLWLYDLAQQSTVQLTDLAIAPLSSLPVGRYSRREREIGPGIWSGPTYRWSADGRYIAVHVVDRRHMRKVPFPDYLAEETDPNLVRRGYPGDPNESRRVGLLEVATGELTWLALAAPTANQIIDFTWSPSGMLLLDVASDTAVDRWLYTVDPADRKLHERWHSHRPSRIYTAFAAAWHSDGQGLLFLSDLDDRYGLYSLAAEAPPSLASRLTARHYDVLSAPTVIASTQEVYFSANGAGPAEQHVYSMSLEEGVTRQITHTPGRHVGFPSPDGSYLATLHSSDQQPTELFVARSDGGERRRITHSPPAAFDQIAWGTPRYLSFPSRIDENILHARLLLPPDFDDTRRYPVLFGPVYSNTVRNRWAGNYALVQHLLAQRGYVVVQVDVRGSTGYGRDFREAFLVDFAGDDIEDLASAVGYLKTLPYVDGERMGIWGSSYGGTLTVYSLLTRPGLFCAGVAAASAVDPYFFGTDDVAIVRRPDTHPEIFERAARRYAAHLEDHLLLIHGMQDHVVPFKTTAVLADELIKAGKDFDFAFAPGATHGWSREPANARYLFGKLVAHFDRYLQAEPACSNGD